MNYELKNILSILDIPYVEIPYGVYIKYDLEMIKKKYKLLIKQYHPDNSISISERRFKEEKMTEINVSMDKLLDMIKNNEVFIPKSSKTDFDEDYNTYNESNDFKEENFNNSSNINSDIDKLIDDIDRLKKSVNSKLGSFSNIQKYKIVDNLVNYLENVKDLISIYIERNEEYDYWDYINYIDLFYYYFNQTLNVSSTKYNKKLNYKFKNNILFEEKNKLSLLHRKLLFNKTNELISLYKEFENKNIDLNE